MGLVIGVATVKITITLQQKQFRKVRALVAAGEAASVSGFVRHAVTTALHDASGWKELLENALEQAGGPLTQEERSWVDAILSGQKQMKGSRKRKVA